MLPFTSKFSGFQHPDHCDSQEVFMMTLGSNRGVSVELQILFLIQLLYPEAQGEDGAGHEFEDR